METNYCLKAAFIFLDRQNFTNYTEPKPRKRKKTWRKPVARRYISKDDNFRTRHNEYIN